MLSFLGCIESVWHPTEKRVVEAAVKLRLISRKTWRVLKRMAGNRRMLLCLMETCLDYLTQSTGFNEDVHCPQHCFKFYYWCIYGGGGRRGRSGNRRYEMYLAYLLPDDSMGTSDTPGGVAEAD